MVEEDIITKKPAISPLPRFRQLSHKAIYMILVFPGPYGLLLACFGFPRQDASFFNNQMVPICAKEIAHIQLETILCKFRQICATGNALMQLETI